MEWLLSKAFIIPCGNWLEGEMAEDIPEGFEMAFMPSFWHDSTNTSTYVGSSPRISIAANTKNPEAAKAFLQVLFSKNVTQAVAECQMGIPCMRDDLEGVELTASNQDILKQVSEGSVQIINEVGGSGNFEPYAELRTATTNAISSIPVSYTHLIRGAAVNLCGFFVQKGQLTKQLSISHSMSDPTCRHTVR